MTHLLLPLVVAAVAAADPPVDAQLLDGRAVSGAIVRWDAEGLTVAGEAGEVTLPVERLLTVRWPGGKATVGGATFMQLVDGTRLAIADFRVRQGAVEASTPYSSQPLRIRTTLVTTVELQPASEASRAAWRELETKNLAGDVLLVAKRDGQSVDYLAGILGDVTADKAEFDWEGDRLEVKRSKIAAIAYHHNKPAEYPEALCRLETADGSQVPAREVALEDGRLRVVTPAGVKLTLAVADVRQADFSAGKLAYLSDMKPVLAAWTPRIATPLSADLQTIHGTPRSDQSFAGSALTLAWKDAAQPGRRSIRVYSKGLAVRSRTELEYRLPAGMQRFVAVAGIDPAAASQGRIELEIRGDGRLLWQGAVAGKRDPVELDVKLNGARRLQLVVDYGENLDYGDRLHLVEARVTK
jgi:hypothetical protein